MSPRLCGTQIRWSKAPANPLPSDTKPENNVPKIIRGSHTRGTEARRMEKIPYFMAELKPVRGVLQRMTSSYFTHQIESKTHLKLGFIGTPRTLQSATGTPLLTRGKITND